MITITIDPQHSISMLKTLGANQAVNVARIKELVDIYRATKPQPATSFIQVGVVEAEALVTAWDVVRQLSECKLEF